ncbi:MAG: 3-dehydro-L-gulonate 2-dehydrogenase [Chitinophagaceae bacterium]|nr:3-dehydro-L-gulonate 2-dehydrogenase [Chitinophagaceae bacterium]
MIRISFAELKSTIKQAFLRAGMPEDRAETCAQIHTETTCDGVNSHGINRVERFIEYIHSGLVDVHASPKLAFALGAMEIYDGQLGPGILNALFAMDRATVLAAQHGLAMVALRNTTHWMRGGTYGWLAADKGFIGICWTNTESCMPPWGSRSEAVGNNPFVMAVPRKEGHLVLDMAMSQFSYGKVWSCRDKNIKLPFPGGFDHEGNLTDDAAAISETRRILPMGYWKGSGFAIMLDVIGALVSNGLATAGIDKANKGSAGSSSQVFIAIDPEKMNTREFIEQTLESTIAQLKAAVPVKEGGQMFYPGEQSLNTRKQNLQNGIPVDEPVWNKIKELAAQ